MVDYYVNVKKQYETKNGPALVINVSNTRINDTTHYFKMEKAAKFEYRKTYKLLSRSYSRGTKLF
jgi:hypothetical protein